MGQNWELTQSRAVQSSSICLWPFIQFAQVHNSPLCCVPVQRRPCLRHGLLYHSLPRPQVTPPPRAGALEERPAKATAFRKFYDRGDFPIALEHDTKGNKIAWKVGTTWNGIDCEV